MATELKTSHFADWPNSATTLAYNAFALRWKHVRAAISRGMALGWEHAVHKSDPIHEDFQARMQGKITINAAPMDT